MFETFSNLEEEKLSPLPVSHVEGGRPDPPEDGHPRRPEEAELDQRGVLREAQADLVSGAQWGGQQRSIVHTSQGSFPAAAAAVDRIIFKNSAVSKPNFSSKYSFENS